MPRFMLQITCTAAFPFSVSLSECCTHFFPTFLGRPSFVPRFLARSARVKGRSCCLMRRIYMHSNIIFIPCKLFEALLMIIWDSVSPCGVGCLGLGRWLDGRPRPAPAALHGLRGRGRREENGTLVASCATWASLPFLS